MNEIKGLSHVCITVNDMDETLKFYQEVIGCKLKDRFQLDWVNVELAHVDMNGQEIEFTHKSDTPRLRTDRWEVGHIAFKVFDIYKVAEKLATVANIKFIDEKPNVVNENLITFFIEGPSGEVIEFMEYK